MSSQIAASHTGLLKCDYSALVYALRVNYVLDFKDNMEKKMQNYLDIFYVDYRLR